MQVALIKSFFIAKLLLPLGTISINMNRRAVLKSSTSLANEIEVQTDSLGYANHIR